MTQPDNSNSSDNSLPVPQRRTSVRARKSTQQQATQSDGISPTFLWWTFCQWWKWAVPAGVLLASLAGALVWYSHVPEYQAQALILIESDAPFIAFESSSGKGGADRYVQTQIELLRSSVILGPLLSLPEIASMKEIKTEVNPLKHLRKHLTISQVGKSELYTVSYQSPSAKDAATIANTLVSQYLIRQAKEDKKRSQLVIVKLEKGRLERKLNVERLRQRVVDLAKDLTGKDPFGQGAVTDISRVLSPVSALAQSLNEVEVNREVLKAELQALQDESIVFSDQAESSGLLDLEIANRSDVRELQASISALGETMVYLKSVPRQRIGATWEEDPEYLRLHEQSGQLTARLTALKMMLRKEFHALRVEQRRADRQQLTNEMQRQLASLNTKQTLLKSKLDKHLEELKSGGGQSAQLEFAKSELEREEKVFELIAARKLALQTEIEAPARVSLKNSASVPSIALEAIPYKLLLISCLASLVCPFGLALAHEVTSQRIATSAQLANESLLPSLGEIARFPVRPVATSQKNLSHRQQREMFVFAESIDNLRTNLLLTQGIGTKDQHRIIAVASATSGEGKTSVATALAMSIAGATSEPTLLVDADLRAPDAAQVLGVGNHPGLTEVLAGTVRLADAIYQVGDTNTYVLPAGKQRVNPHHVLGGAKVEQLLDSLRAKFPTIIVDTPPILGASESLVYAQAADLVVFCSMVKVSRAKQVRDAVERLQATGANVAGSVLSGVSVGRHAYSYGYTSYGDASSELGQSV